VTRTLRGWAILVLHEAGAIRECEEHGWMQDRADPYCSRAGLRRRASGFGDWLLSGGGCRRGPRCSGFDRRFLSECLSEPD
jgi:hypothetical protein